MEKYGFVYIWFDRKHKRYYIGCHWGLEDDGYICSSVHMKRAYKRRSQDFKRRIISRIYSSKKDLLEEEYRWLSMIKNEELNIRYYNLSNRKFNHYTADSIKAKTAQEKRSITVKNNPNWGVWNKGDKNGMKKQEVRDKVSISVKNFYLNNPDFITEMSKRCKSYMDSLTDEERKEKYTSYGGLGKIPSIETREKMSRNNAMNNPIHVQKIKDKKIGIKWLTNGINRKMAVPGTQRFYELVSTGYRLISDV